MVFIFCTNVFADVVVLNLDFQVSNVAKSNEKKEKNANIENIPYSEIKNIHNYYREQTNLDREINLDWHVVNYKASKELFSKRIKGLSDNVEGYHLFDIIWFTPRFVINYQNDKTGRWEKVYSLPSGFRVKVPSEATIKGYGNVPVYTTPGLQFQMLMDEPAQQIDGFDEVIVKELSNEKYFVRVIQAPVIKSVYIKLDDVRLLDKKLEIFGTTFLGTSGIVTSKSSFFYPYDRYIFKFIFKSHYPSQIICNLDDAEDLDVAGSKRVKVRATANEAKTFEFEFIRKNIIEKILLPITVLLYTIATQFFKTAARRLLSYIVMAIFVYFTIPQPLNVPTFNMLYLGTWSLFFIFIFGMENRNSGPKLSKSVHSKKQKK